MRHDFQTAFGQWQPEQDLARVDFTAIDSASGFSGALIWRVRWVDDHGLSQQAALRAWPTSHPQPDRLRWMGQQLENAAENCSWINLPYRLATSNPGSPPFPHPRPFRPGDRFCRIGQRLWQLEPWVSGENNFLAQPQTQRMENAFQALAQVHRHWIDQTPPAAGNVSSGLQQRLRQLADWQARPATIWEEITTSARQCFIAGQLERDDLNLVQQIMERWHQEHREMRSQLQQAVAVELPVGTVLADVWSDHLFFKGERLHKIIDYGAMRIDSAAADLSRLLSSMAGDNLDTRRVALASYQTIRTLNKKELQAIEVFDRSSELLGPLLWLDWLFLEKKFVPSPAILDRISRVFHRQPF